MSVVISNNFIKISKNENGRQKIMNSCGKNVYYCITEYQKFIKIFLIRNKKNRHWNRIIKHYFFIIFYFILFYFCSCC